MVKDIVNIHEDEVLNSEEIVFQVENETQNAVINWEERNIEGATLQIYTAPGATGDLLIEGSDYELYKQNTSLSETLNKGIYQGVSIINTTYHNTDLYIPQGTLNMFGDFVDESDINELQTQVDSILSGTSQALLGQEVSLPYYEDLSKYGLLARTFDYVSTGRYPEWYAKIGNSFDSAHESVGQSAAPTGYFYPTLPPGDFDRCGLPDLIFNSGNVFTGSDLLNGIDGDWYTNTKNVRGNGGVFKIKAVDGATLPEPFTEGQELYVRYYNDSVFQIRLYADELSAINNGTYIDITTSGSGTFKLTQEGIRQDHALEEHNLINPATGWKVNPFSVGRPTDDGNVEGVTVYLSDNETSSTLINNGNTSNETRPSYVTTYKYTKVENVIPFVGEPVSGVKYDWELGEATRDWRNQNYIITHNLGEELKNLNVNIEWKRTGAWDWRRLEVISYEVPSAVDEDYGYVLIPIDENSFKIKTGASGVLGMADTGDVSSLDSNTEGNVRATIIKYNFSDPIIDQPKYTNQSYTLADGDTISLTAQNSIITVNPTSADMSFTITGVEYNGQHLIVKNIGDYSCEIVNNVGGWLKNATVPKGQSAECAVANDELTEGSFSFVWDVATEIGFENSWVNFGNTYYNATVVYKYGEVCLIGMVTGGTNGQAMFTVPLSLRTTASKLFTVPTNTTDDEMVIENSGVVRNSGSSSNGYVSLDPISWKVGI